MSESEEPWTQEGRFWLPGSDEKTYGHIDYAPEGDIIVHLVKSPLPPSDVGDAPASVQTLHGETLDGWPFSLLNGAVVRPRVLTRATQGISDLRFATLVRGPHVNEADEVVGTMAHVGLRGLREFLRGGLQDQALLATSPEDEQGDSVSVEMPWGSLGLYIAGGPTHLGQNEVRFAVRAHAQIEFHDETTLWRVDELVEPLRDLIAFSTRRPSTVTGLQLLGASNEDGVHWQHRREFKVVRVPEAPPDVRAPSDFCALMLNPATVAQGGDIIASWYELRASLGPVWPLFFATLADPWMTRESQLLNLTSFAEGYHRTLHDVPPLSNAEADAATCNMLAALRTAAHRKHYLSRLRYANTQSQRARIRRLTGRALKVAEVWDLDVDVVCAQVVDTRNWLTHWGDRGEHVQEGDEIVLLCRRLYVILSINLLLDLGLNIEDTRRQIGSGLRGQGLP